MKKLIILDSKGESKNVHLSEELLNSEPKLATILNRVIENGNALSKFDDSTDSKGDNERNHSKRD